MLEYDAGVRACAVLAHDLSPVQRLRVERRSRFAARFRPGRQVHIPNQSCVEQRRRERAAPDARHALDAEAAQPPKRIAEVARIVHHDERDPGSRLQRLAHRVRGARDGDQDHAQLGDVEHQSLFERQTLQRGDDLHRMPRQPHRRAQLHELGAPHRQHEVAAANRARACQHGVGRHAREPFVDQMPVGVAAAERRRVPRAGVAVARLHEDEARRGPFRRRGGREIERAVEQRPRPRVADRLERSVRLVPPGRERLDGRRERLGGLSRLERLEPPLPICNLQSEL
jgi:hypothetical protein